MKVGTNVVFKKIFDSYLFSSTMVDVKGLKIRDAKHILSNILQINEDNVFSCKLMKLVFLNNEFNSVYHFVKEPFV